MQAWVFATRAIGLERRPELKNSYDQTNYHGHQHRVDADTEPLKEVCNDIRDL